MLQTNQVDSFNWVSLVNLFARWNLTDAQAAVLLGGLSVRTWVRWKVGTVGRIPRDLR